MTAVTRTAVCGGPKCRELRWCGLLGGEGIWEIPCGDYRIGFCGAEGCRVGRCCVEVSWRGLCFRGPACYCLLEQG